MQPDLADVLGARRITVISAFPSYLEGMRSVGEKEAGGSKEVSASCWISCLGCWVYGGLLRCMEVRLVHACGRGVEGLGSWQGIPLSAASVLPGSHYSPLRRPTS